MREDFGIHNLFWKSEAEFARFDPQLARLEKLPYVYHSPLIEEIPIQTPGIYILTGGRQVGKSTALKLAIKSLLKQKKISPSKIYYLPCDTIKDFSQLLFEIEQFGQTLTPADVFVLFLDEITYVKEWPRAIKSLADAGFFKHGSVLITGSDIWLLKNAMMELPGRRGMADRQDFHLFPLSFYEYALLKNPRLFSLCQETATAFQKSLIVPKDKIKQAAMSQLWQLFNEYLLTGGYLSAINDYALKKSIRNAIYKTYSQWIIGDILKRGKSEASLKEIIKALYPRLSKQVTWHSFANDLSIEHHQTISDYFSLLQRMDVLVILQALREDKLKLAPKKAKKICFGDPFIFHALHGWAQNSDKSFLLAKELLAAKSELKNVLIEGVIAALYSRGRETCYIKAEAEVDLALLTQKQFFPIEVKDTLVLNRQGLKQIIKYKQGLVGYAGLEIGSFEQLQVIPLPLLAYLAG
jgi:predicted AAA+ superfamily ATPase